MLVQVEREKCFLSLLSVLPINYYVLLFHFLIQETLLCNQTLLNEIKVPNTAKDFICKELSCTFLVLITSEEVEGRITYMFGKIVSSKRWTICYTGLFK